MALERLGIEREGAVDALATFAALFGEVAPAPPPSGSEAPEELRRWLQHDTAYWVTGPWQVAGRSNIPFHDMIRFDYQYVAGWSLARDVEILLSTLPAVLSGRGAY